MPGLTARKVEKDSPVEAFCRELYEETFDRRMRVPYRDLWKVADKGYADYVAVFDSDIFLGFYYVFFHKENVFIYYLAVCPEMRDRGYGTDIGAAVTALISWTSSRIPTLRRGSSCASKPRTWMTNWSA